MALHLVPAAHISTLFNDLCPQAISDPLRRLFGYVDSTWINSPVWPPSSWPAFRCPVRTDNDVEGWHYRLNLRARSCHLPLYVLIRLLHDKTQVCSLHVKLVEVYKILTNKYDSGVNLYLEKQQDNITRGHSLKLVNNRYHYDLRKFSFAPRIVNVWNSLPEILISAATTDTFKKRLDKFWQHQDIYYMIIRSS